MAAARTADRPGDGSTANEASVVLLVEVAGGRMLLTGDVEPEGQAALAAALPGLHVDVLKVPHHGSRYQDEPWLLSLGARVALVSVGADNDYGHPAAALPLEAAGARVLRTDLDGDSRSSRRRRRRSRPGTGRLTDVGGAVAGLPHHGRSSQPRAADVLGRVTLVTGKEEFLNERTVVGGARSVRRYDAESEFSETAGLRPLAGTLGELAAPSLFSSIRCVVVRGLENLPDESVDGLLAYAARRPTRSRWCSCTAAAPKGSGVLTKLRKLAAVTESKSGELRASEYPGFVAAEVGGHGATIDRDAADVLVQAVGQDLRSLAAAADQLTSDFAGEPITAEKVKQYFGGRAEAKSFAVADAAFWGRRTEALEELRWALDGGTAAVLVTSAFAGGPRGGPLPSAPRGMREADLAREVGVPPWKLRTIRDQSRGWSDGGIARAIQAIARADADIKGAASDASYTLERLVLTVTGLRDRADASDAPKCRTAPTRRDRRLVRRGGSERGGLLGDRGLAVRGLVLVDDALGGGLVELAGGVLAGLDGGVLVAGLGGLAELADGGLQAGLDGLVALVRLLVLLVALDLGLDVRHWCAFGRGVIGC